VSSSPADPGNGLPRLRFWGVRGSFPAALPSCRRLGGNTSCVELEWQGHRLILDAGTGIRKLGERLIAQPSQHPLHLLITHPHWDHIQGFPFFAPAYAAGTRLNIHCLQRSSKMQYLLSDQQQATFFSVPLERMESELSFQEWEEGEPFQSGPFRVETWKLNHPGTCSGFRIRAGDVTVSYLPDVAPSSDYLLADPLPGNPTREQSLRQLHENQLRLTEGADVVIYDTFFTPELYEQRSHWGHSTLEQAVEVCTGQSVANLFMFHHNSEISDDEQLARKTKARLPDGLQLHVAREGTAYEVGPRQLVSCE
jgi:phosphoribosyl 1,2-cyclic phosphodiesterase